MLKKILRKIHILHSIYIKHKYFIKKSSYAMDGEDTAVLDYFKKKKMVFMLMSAVIIQFIETILALLHEKNWNGINIDTSQFSIDLFDYMRPNDLNYNCAISNKNETILIILSERT